MIRLTEKQIKKTRGIIVWDFDRVLFDTDRFIKEREKIMRGHGIPANSIARAHKFMTNLVARTAERPFSTTFFLENLKKDGVRFKEKVLRDDFKKLLVKCRYLDPSADRILHHLRRHNFINIIMSWGSAPYQYQKIRTVCGNDFLRHFVRVIVTTKPKYAVIGEMFRRFPSVPAFFVDDSDEHIGLVKKHLPRVRAIHFTGGKSLQKVRQEILRFCR